MGHLKFFLSLLFLLTFSFVFAFAETGDLTVVSGKEFKVHYEAKDLQVLSVEPNKDDFGLVFSIQANSPVATLELTLPRELIDSTNANGKDSDYIVLLDGTFVSYVNEGSNSTSRTILIQLASDNTELEIIGTHLSTATSAPQANNPQTAQPTVQNESSIPQQPSQVNTERATKTEQKQPLNETISSLQLKSGNLSLNLDKKQLVEYSVIGAIVLIITIVIASSARSKTRSQIRK